MAHTYSVNINAINIHNKSGSLVTILLEEQPKITFEGNDVVLTTHMNVVNYPSAEIVKLTYLDVKDATGIDNFNSFGVVREFFECERSCSGKQLVEIRVVCMSYGLCLYNGRKPVCLYEVLTFHQGF